MTIYNAYLIKGYLIDKKAPKRIMEALDTLIGGLHATDGKLQQSEPPHPDQGEEVEEEEPVAPVAVQQSVAAVVTAPVVAQVSPEVREVAHIPVASEPVVIAKKSNGWSPGRRAAQSQRLAELRASGVKIGRQKKTGQSAPTATLPHEPPHRLTVAHPDYAGKRDRGQPLTDEDWPDIKARLAKSPDRRAIASDYDIELDDLNFFITSCQRREAKSPGEAPAPLSAEAAGAKRTTW